MKEKNTRDLELVLGSTHIKNFNAYCEENADSLANILLNYNKDYFHKIGENAANQLYISWQQSVEHAVERYKYVLEKFNYQKKPLFKMDMQDGMFALWAQLSNGIEKAKQNRLRIEEEFKEIKRIFMES